MGMAHPLQLACQTIGANDCIASTGATGFGLENLSISFGPAATTRSSGYAVDIETCTGCSIENVSLNNGDLSGLRLASSTHTSIHNLTVSNFYANGTFMINNQDLRLDGLACQNNQDACFETSWFDSEYSAHGVPCQNITATNITSTNDLEGVLVNACNNVTVSGFAVIGSAKESIFVGQDPTTTTAHWPDRVAISNGTIYGAGYGTNPLNTATAQALYVNVGTNPSGPISHVTFANITASHVSSWGLQMAEFQNDDVNLSNLQFYDVGNGSTTGCLQTEGNQVNLNAVYCTDVGTYGLYDTNTVRLTGTGLNFSGVSQVSGTDSIYLSTTATGLVNLTNISVNDTNPIDLLKFDLRCQPFRQSLPLEYLVNRYPDPYRAHQREWPDHLYVFGRRPFDGVPQWWHDPEFCAPELLLSAHRRRDSDPVRQRCGALLPVEMLVEWSAADGIGRLAGPISHALYGELLL